MVALPRPSSAPTLVPPSTVLPSRPTLLSAAPLVWLNRPTFSAPGRAMASWLIVRPSPSKLPLKAVPLPTGMKLLPCHTSLAAPAVGAASTSRARV